MLIGSLLLIGGLHDTVAASQKRSPRKPSVIVLIKPSSTRLSASSRGISPVRLGDFRAIRSPMQQVAFNLNGKLLRGHITRINRSMREPWWQGVLRDNGGFLLFKKRTAK
jgi:hypothetical protein